MTDIVERLRNTADMNTGDLHLMLHESADLIERFRYVLGGVRGAIKTGRNEPLVIWKEQIDIALEESHPD